MNPVLRVRPTAFTATLLTAAASAQAMDFAALARYSDSRNGHALIVSENGKVLFEKYSNGWSATRAHRLASGTKSFTGVLLAMAVDDGLFRFDEKVADTITEWKRYTYKSQITYRQLVGLVSGLDGGRNGPVPTYAASVLARMLAPPQKRFQYGPNPFQAFGEALKRKLLSLPAKETVRAWVTRKLETPLGMKVAFWTEKARGEPNLPSGAFLTAREWLKFGEMIRGNGLLGNKRVVSSANLGQLFRGTTVNPTYGVGWWLRPGASSLPKDTRMAKGAGKQRLYVIPSRGLVILRYGETLRSFNDEAFLAALFPSRYTEFGSGCRGSAGTPRLSGDPTRPPAYGKTLVMHLSSVPARAGGLVHFGSSRDRFFAFKLPLDLGPLGMPGCSLLASPELPIPFTAGATGFATLSVPLPAEPALLGQLAYFQALVLDPKANLPGLTTSNGLEARIGLR